MIDQPFRNDTILYNNQQYFQDIAGGINNVGLSTPIGGGSVGWEVSMHTLLMQEVKQSSTKFSQLCATDKAKVVVTGYITFTQGMGDTLFAAIQPDLKMNGVKWLPAICGINRPRTGISFTNDPWSIIYFREDSLEMPQDWFDRLRQPMNIFGDIFPFSMGGQDCIMKAHGAAVIVNQSHTPQDTGVG